MLQISNFVYCDDIFKNIEVENKILPNPYKNYPFLIIENFISEDLAKDIVKSTKAKSDIQKAKVKTQKDNGIMNSSLNEEYRKTNIYKLEDEYLDIYHKNFLKNKSKIERYFNTALTTGTDVQVLEYEKGYFYTKHADDSSEMVDKQGNTVGFVNVAPQRKLTTVLFSSSCDEDKNDDFHFSGGELLFNYLYDSEGNQVKVKPKAGDMVVFPSNPYFSHEVLTVKSGYRLTLVQWYDAILL